MLNTATIFYELYPYYGQVNDKQAMLEQYVIKLEKLKLDPRKNARLIRSYETIINKTH